MPDKGRITTGLYAPYLYSVSGDGRPPPDTGESVSHEIQQFLLFGIAGNVGQGDADDVFGSLFQMIAAGHMRGDQAMRLIPQRTFRRQRLRLGDVQSGTVEPSIVQGVSQGLGIDGVATPGINHDGCGFQTTQTIRIQQMMGLRGYIDVLIPRGGASLIQTCVNQAKVPCIQTGTGICHIYVDGDADLQKALSVVENAKTSRPSVCNAEEVCLVHRAVAARFLPMLKKALVDDRAAQGLTPVELRLDAAAAQIIDGKSASDKDFDTEYLDYILAVGVVDSLDAAIAHVLAHSTHHSDAIVTEDAASAERFINGTDSAATYVNVSTRFTDGGEFGLGCEMGISTQKLHARGPMGLDELSTYKYIIRGDGQIR